MQIWLRLRFRSCMRLKMTTGQKGGHILGKRALTDDAKRRKKLHILQAAERIFAEDRKLHSSAKIAKESQVAKGTLYLYFQTKEEIYMELLVEAFCRWHEELRNRLLDQNLDAKSFIGVISSTIAQRTLFIDLYCLSGSVIEDNLSVDVVRTGRQRMRQETSRTGDLMAKYFPDRWTEERAKHNLKRFYTYAFAYWRECFPTKNVEQAFPEEFSDKAKQKRVFEAELADMNRLIWDIG